jgi:hypothetical protein
VRQGKGGVGPGVPCGGGRKRKRGGGSVVGPWGRNGSGRHGRRQQRALTAEARWRTREGCRAQAT